MNRVNLRLVFASILLAGGAAVFGAGEEDLFEPDNSPAEARIWQPGQYDPPPRNFHRPDDEDWVKIYLVGDEYFILDALQLGNKSDVQVQVFFQPPDGQLEPLGPPINQSEQGPGIHENVDMYMGGGRFEQGPPQGFYYIRYTPGNPDAWGPESDYRFVVTSPTLDDRPQGRGAVPAEEGGTGGAAYGYLICVGADRLYTNLPPKGSRCVVEGVAEEVFTNQNIYFLVPEGAYNVFVTADDGYEPIEDPDLPDQTKNSTNEFYGNPKTRVIVASGWDIAVFQMAPYGRVTANVRDGITGGYVQNAAVSFTAASGILTNLGLSFTSYQDNRYYATDWVTGSGGDFPSDVRLPTTNWHLTIEAPGYLTNTIPDAVPELQLREDRDLGTIYLDPLDSDGDGLADSWEETYLGSIDYAPDGDEDSDGKSNKDEYLDGTDPGDPDSFFGWNAPSNGSFTLTWRAAPGRAYQVKSASDLESQAWTNRGSPQSAAAGQSALTWIDTDTASLTTRYYQVQRVAP